MSEEEPRHRHHEPRRHPVLRRVGIGVLALLVVVACSVVLVYNHLNNNIHHIDLHGLGKRPTAIKVAGPTQPLNVLVMGSDTRAGANGVGIGGETPGLSDTTILLHVSADRQFAYGVSLPRDAMVERPSCEQKGGGVDPGGLTQFNAAYAIGGPLCTLKTVEHLTGVHIDHFLVVDFVGFRKMVDAVHGVTVCVPKAIEDSAHQINLPAGTYSVDGEQALNYVRERYDVGDGSDIGRMKRQQTFVAAMIKKVVSAGTLANPIRLYNFLDAATKSITTDTGLSNLRQMASLASSLKHIGLGHITFITVPIEPYPENVNRLQWAPSSAQLWQRIKHDRRLGSTLGAGAVRAADTTTGQAPSSKPSGSATGSPGQSSQPGESASEREAIGLCA